MRSEGYSTWSVCLLLNISLFTCLFVPQTILTFSVADEGVCGAYLSISLHVSNQPVHYRYTLIIPTISHSLHLYGYSVFVCSNFLHSVSVSCVFKVIMRKCTLSKNVDIDLAYVISCQDYFMS